MEVFGISFKYMSIELELSSFIIHSCWQKGSKFKNGQDQLELSKDTVVVLYAV